jgi:hypothetical protein
MKGWIHVKDDAQDAGRDLESYRAASNVRIHSMVFIYTCPRSRTKTCGVTSFQTPTLCATPKTPWCVRLTPGRVCSSSLVLVIILILFFPATQTAQHPVLLIESPNLPLQLSLALALTLERSARVVGHSAQPRLPLGMLQPQLHRHGALFLEQPLVVLVQCEDGRGLVVCIRPQFVQQERQRILVVGQEGLQRRVAACECREVVLCGCELGLEVGDFGVPGRCCGGLLATMRPAGPALGRRRARTIQLSIDLSEGSVHRPPFLGSPRPDSIDAVDDAQCLLLVVLQHLAQLLHHGPEVVHVCLLAPRGQAVDHGDAVLLCAVAVVLGAVLRGRGRGRGRRAWLHVLLHVGGQVRVVVGVRVGGEERVVVHRGARCGVGLRAARFAVVE